MELVFVVIENNFDYYAGLLIKTKQLTRAKRTAEWYKEVLKQFREIVGMDWPPRPRHLLAFFESLKARSLSESTQNTYYRAVRSWLNWLYKNGLIPENPTLVVDGPKAPRHLPKAPPENDVTRLLATIDQNLYSWQVVRDIALFSLALDTGARIGELATLRLEQIDMIHQEIIIYGSKDKADRKLEFDDSAAADLGRWLNERARLGVPHSLRHVWVSNYQRKEFRPLTGSGMRQRLKFWQIKAGINRFPFHAFRHAYAVYSLRNRADLLDIKEQLGHSSIKTTAIYLEVVNQGRKERHRKTSPRGNLSLGQEIDAGPGLC